MAVVMPWARVPSESRRALANETFDRVVELIAEGDWDEANRVLTRAAHTCAAIELFTAIVARTKAGDADHIARAT